MPLKDFAEYETKLPYPSAADYARANVYRRGKVLRTDLNFEQLREFAERVGVSTAGKHSLAGLAGALSVEGFVVERVEAPGYQEARQKYHEDQGRLHEEFRQDLFDAHGVVGHPKADKVYSYAYDRGHAHGYQEVALIFGDLVELIK